jgi:hypothetical protein
VAAVLRSSHQQQIKTPPKPRSPARQRSQIFAASWLITRIDVVLFDLALGKSNCVAVEQRSLHLSIAVTVAEIRAVWIVDRKRTVHVESDSQRLIGIGACAVVVGDFAARAFSFARAKAGNSKPAKTAMMAMTTNNSMRVKPAARDAPTQVVLAPRRGVVSLRGFIEVAVSGFQKTAL